MTRPTDSTRRTVLKTVPVALLGGSVVAGTASAARGGASSATQDSTAPQADLEIVAKHDHEAEEHLFELGTAAVPAGWTTVEFDNQTEHTHFTYLAKLPQAAIDAANEADADLLEFYVEHVTRPFQWFMDNTDPSKEPDPDDLSDRYSNLEEEVVFPPWFQQVQPSGGVGLTSPDTTAAATFDLGPGKYVVECYVKDSDGEFHSYNGMIDLLTVTDEQSGAAAPDATVDLSLSTDGIDAPDSVSPGEHTVAVRFEDQKLYSNLIGHDAHLIRFDGETTAVDVNGWTNWAAPDQFVADGSEPGTFLGGVQTIRTAGLLEGADDASETAYVHVDLDPGSYAWVAEVPDPNAKDLLNSFGVRSGGGTGSPDAEGSATPATPPGSPTPDAGSSWNFGGSSEAEDDDLSDLSANSGMDDDLKAMFDRLANYDLEDVR